MRDLIAGPAIQQTSRSAHNAGSSAAAAGNKQEPKASGPSQGTEAVLSA
jgi:hypothetical protein